MSQTSFNSQSSRAIVLLHGHHEKFWNLVKDKIKSIVDDKTWRESSSGRLQGFQNAYGCAEKKKYPLDDDNTN